MMSDLQGTLQLSSNLSALEIGKSIMDFNSERWNVILQGVRIIDGDDFTETYDTFDSDLEEFDGFDDDYEDEIVMDELDEDLPDGLDGSYDDELDEREVKL